MDLTTNKIFQLLIFLWTHNRKVPEKHFRTFGCYAIFKRYEGRNEGNRTKKKINTTICKRYFHMTFWWFYRLAILCLWSKKKIYISKWYVWWRIYLTHKYTIPSQGPTRLRNIKASPDMESLEPNIEKRDQYLEKMNLSQTLKVCHI